MSQSEAADGKLRLLLVEDDDGDALLVEEHLADAGQTYIIDRARSVAEAAPLIDRADCALVDLGLPDARDDGVTALTRIRAMASDLPIVVLTGVAEQARGLDALSSGAQDYLVKGEVDGPQLTRALRYAVERCRAENDARLLLLAEQRQAENDRLARGLLPLLDIDSVGDTKCTVATRYRPGADALLGGDFYDAIVLPDGRLRVVIGDVCGHGATEAALGVALRIAWRTLTLAGASETDTLATVEQVLLRERDESVPFATICDLTIDPGMGTLTVRRNGHPPPMLLAPRLRWVEEAPVAPPLGCVPSEPSVATAATVGLPPGWSLLLMTDGIFEGRVPGGRLGTDGLIEMVGRLAPGAASPDVLLDALIARAQELNGGDLEDDLALLWIGTTGVAGTAGAAGAAGDR
jgi:serine phosphatase RsbU (regulator of sigma subunit)